MPDKPLTFEDYDMSPEPLDIERIYDSGFRGTLRNEESQENLAEVAVPFSQVFPNQVEEMKSGRGRGKVWSPWRCVMEYEPEFGVYEAQTTGDCVSHGTRNAGMIDYCCDAMFGETVYRGRFATENIYSARGHNGQGASCHTLAYYVSPEGDGGFLVRLNYQKPDSNDSINLSTYNSSIGARRGRRGFPDWLNEIARKNQAQQVYSITTEEEVIAALSQGFGILVCGVFGHGRRDENGVASDKRRIAHAEAWIGVDDSEFAHNKYGGPLVLEVNSWGDYIGGGKRHEQPDGSCYIRPRTMKRVLEGGSAHVIASVRGYDREPDYYQTITDGIRSKSDD